MNRQIDPRRIGLSLLFAAWLAVQTLVVGVSPTWGFVLPHEHITRGVMSETAWRNHLLEHEFGAIREYEWRCDGANGTRSDVIASVPENAGAFSFLSFAAATLQDSRVEIPSPYVVGVTYAESDFFALAMDLAPLDPPPTI